MAAREHGNERSRAEEEASIRRITHISLLEQYKKLIPVIKLQKKNSKAIDEFNIPECIICMDIHIE